MISTIFLVIFLGVGLVLLLLSGRWFPDRPDGYRGRSDEVEPKIVRRTGRAIGIVFLLVAVFIGWTSMTIQVEPSDVGIKTAFGHTQGGDLRPGLHPKWPWESVTIWDASNQREEWIGNNCLEIRISGGQSACLNVVLQWRDNPSDADAQFVQYRQFSNISRSLVSKAIVTGYFNQEFEKFDPVAAAAAATCQVKPGQDPAEAAKGCVNQQSGTQISALVGNVQANLKNALAGKIIISSLSGGNIDYDTQIDDALNKLVLSRQNTLTAIQDEQTALAKSQANKELQDRQKLTPELLYYDCVQATLQMANPPAAWNCGSPQSLALLLGGGK